MAEWNYGVNDAATVKLFSHRLFKQAIQATTVWKLCNISSSVEDGQNICQILDDTQKSEGDQITYDILAELEGAGVQGDNILAGNEEAISTFTDSLVINQLRHPVLVKGAMSQQRVPFNKRDQAKLKLANWWAKRFEVSAVNHLAGNTNQADTRYTGNNAVSAPSSMVIAAGAANEGALVNGNGFTIDLIDTCVAIAHTRVTPIRPIQLDGMEIFGVMFIHPLQTRSLRANFTAGQWGAIQSDALAGGQITKNPIFSGAIGLYNNVIIHESAYAPYGSAAQAVVGGRTRYNALGTASVARGFFVGAQALCLAFGRAYSDDMRLKWFEELFDGGNQLRVAAGAIFGMKKTRFNSEDYGVVTVSSFEANV